jgi:hypothetical protein
MHCQHLHFSRHAMERMFERAIPPADVVRIVSEGEWIADYPDDKPYPSTLLLGYLADGPVHAVVAHDSVSDDCIVITVYRPDPALWSEDFKSRRST